MPNTTPIVKSPRQIWAAPGGRHDTYLKLARAFFPSAVGILGATLIFSPLTKSGDVSFVLAKDKVAMSKERLRVEAATYRGEDGKGQPFIIRAGSAVQKSSRDPVVKLSDLSAEILMKDGPASFHASQGSYDMDREIVSIHGPVEFKAADGYRLATRDVALGLKSRKIASGGPVEGQIPLGSFSAGRISADLVQHSVVLDGRARLHIVQGRAK